MWRFYKHETNEYNKLVTFWYFYIVIDDNDCLDRDWFWCESYLACGSENVESVCTTFKFKNGARYISKRSGFACDGDG